MKLTEYLTEIISKKEWRAKDKDDYDYDLNTSYKYIVSQDMDIPNYRKNILPQLKKVFKKLNNGRPTSNLIFDYNSIEVKQKKLGRIDYLIIEVLESLDYDINETTYKLGIAVKDGKEVLISKVIETMSNKLRGLDKMKEVAEKQPKNENLKKQIEALERIERVQEDFDASLIANRKEGAKIVLSIEPRKIASQSTKVGWRSCMNLDTGEYRRKVGEGIQAGTIVAYLAKEGDEYELKSPTARVLLKPYSKKGSNKIAFWDVDKEYGQGPLDFPHKVKKIFEKINKEGVAKEMDGVDEATFHLRGDQYSDLLAHHKKKLSPELQEYIKKGDFEDLQEKSMGIRNVVLAKDIENAKYLGDLTKREQQDIITQHGWQVAEHIKNLDREVAEDTIRWAPAAISVIKNPTEKMYLMALERNPQMIQYVPDEKQTQEMHDMVASGYVSDRILKYLYKPTMSTMNKIVSKNPNAVAHIDEPTEAQLIAYFNNHPAAFDDSQHREKVTEEFIKKAYDKFTKDNTSHQDLDMWFHSLAYRDSIKSKVPNEIIIDAIDRVIIDIHAVQRLSVTAITQRHGHQQYHVKPEIQNALAKRAKKDKRGLLARAVFGKDFISSIAKPTPEFRKASVEANPASIWLFTKPPEELQRLAFRKGAIAALSRVDGLIPELQMKIAKYNYEYTDWFVNIDPEVEKYGKEAGKEPEEDDEFDINLFGDASDTEEMLSDIELQKLLSIDADTNDEETRKSVGDLSKKVDEEISNFTKQTLKQMTDKSVGDDAKRQRLDISRNISNPLINELKKKAKEKGFKNIKYNPSFGILNFDPPAWEMDLEPKEELGREPTEDELRKLAKMRKTGDE